MASVYGFARRRHKNAVGVGAYGEGKFADTTAKGMAEWSLANLTRQNSAWKQYIVCRQVWLNILIYAYIIDVRCRNDGDAGQRWVAAAGIEPGLAWV